MQTKNKYTLWLLAASIALLPACKKFGDFENLNYSPNSPSSPQTTLLLTNAMRAMSGSVGGVPGVVNDNVSRMWVQQWTESFYTAVSRYSTKNYSYSAYYSNPLNDLNMIIKLNTDDATKSAANVLGAGSNANQIGIARILKAFYFQMITDRWGDVPYSEALKGLATVTPKFDEQQAIYTSLFKELKEAIAQLDGGTVKGDIIFGGVTSKWKLFANTIRMNMALRLSKRDPATGKTEFNAALADGVITSNSDNILYKYLGESTNENNVYNNYQVQKRYDYTVTDVFVNKLSSMSDPRLPVYVDPNASGGYSGMPYGLTSGQITAGGYKVGTVDKAGSISLIGKNFRQQNSPVPIFTYAETLFSKAEAYKLGWITGTPDDAMAAATYITAIRASMEQNGVTAPASYFLQPSVAYTPADAIEKIITQKWITNYGGYGFEAWADWRRTGFPTLTPSPNPLSLDKQIPRRQAYALTEKDLNGANYAEAIKRQGPDELATHVWWDK